ncbi:helix-turn-helix transcriptional regulator [Geotalea sp. SG265]|uniref:helix-turn-helix domain-containing protein n=1 Tax=Geotalea sp. SG265 TaxID=2922867 RepID=UPI001FB025A5|nr:helix-turn-helix transcriptional regulator [Geotalea sp. SG265]
MEVNEVLDIIGKRIRNTRKAKGLSQEKLAELASLHPTYISDVERGKVNASVYTYYCIATALEVELADIVKLPSNMIDANFENELSQVLMQIRNLDEGKRGMFISSMKGLLSGMGAK